jgi:hypothetical protein
MTGWTTFTPNVRTADGRWSTVRELRVRTADGQWTRTWPPPAATTTTIAHPAGSPVHGAQVTIPVTVTAQTSNPPQGTVAVSMKVGTTGTWTQKTTLTLVNGTANYIYTVDVVGDVEWRAVYQPTTEKWHAESTGISGTKRYGLATVTTFTTGALTSTTAAFSWSAVSGATEYEILKDGTVLATTTSRSYTATGLSNMTSYKFKVRGKSTTAGGPFYGGYSPERTANIGKDAQPVAGSFVKDLTPIKTGSFQRDGKGESTFSGTWVNGTSGDVRQCHYNNGNYQYYGVMEHDQDAFRDWVTANYGADVYNNLTYTGGSVYMHRIPNIQYSPLDVPVHLYVSNARVGVGTRWDLYLKGDPNFSVVKPGPRGGVAQWVEITPDMTRRVLLDSEFRSLQLKDNDYPNYYAWYYGRNEGACVLRVNCSWNFTRPAIASTWS